MNLIERKTDLKQIRSLLRIFPVVAILGKRQCGKTTIAKSFEFDHYFDLESPRDLAALDHPQLALQALEGLIVIDEIQRKPDFFPLLRHLVDNLPSQRYLILGSASRDLIRQSSETLAGRMGFFNLAGFRIADVGSNEINSLWLRGGLPRSLLAENDEESAVWRENYIATFLERDLPQTGHLNSGEHAQALLDHAGTLPRSNHQLFRAGPQFRHFGYDCPQIYRASRRHVHAPSAPALARQHRQTSR